MQRGAEIAEIIGDSSRHASYTRNRQEAHTVLARLAARPNVAYVRILAADGTTLAAYVGQQEMTLPQPYPPEKLRQGKPLSTEFSDHQSGARYLDLLVPIRTDTPRAQASLLAELPPGTQLQGVVG
ncbi:MAG: hypothetical protein O7G30_17200, partial [Proteobacteria bacterium]|nr:hypothetical protein [Pseudomonadota bacterium]